jgi:hypothetical protein
MNTRVEAIEYLKAAGFYAGERNWSMGETIWIATEPFEGPAGLRLFRRSVCLYPRDGLWSIFNTALMRPVDNERRLPLREACDAAMELLK